MKIITEDKTYFLKSNPPLFNVTLNEFSMKSYELASLNDIIKSSNMNKGSFYYRFKDKKELYFALVDDLYIQQVTYINERLINVSSHLSLLHVTRLLFDSLIYLNSIDPRYLLLNQNIGHESIILKNEIVVSCILSPYRKFIDYFQDSFLNVSNATCYSSYFFDSLMLIYTNFATFLNKPGFDIDDFMMYVSKLDTNKPNNFPTTLPTEILMNVKNVDFSYSPEKAVLNKITFDIHVGEIVAIIGPVGSGKSTLFKLLSGLLLQQHGEVEYFGKELLTSLTFKEEVGFSFDKPCLFRKKTVTQNLNYYKKIYKQEIDINTLLTDFHFENYKDVLVGNLSYDGQVMVNIMRTLINKPKIIIIDHMFSLINQDYIQLIFEMLLKYKQNGSTIVLSDSSISPSIKIADRFLFLKNGMVHSVLTKNALMGKYSIDSVILTYKEHDVVYKKIFSLLEIRTSDFLHFLEDKEIVSLDSLSSKIDEIYSIETGDDLNV